MFTECQDAVSCKRLSTFIKKIIERMVQEETLESLTENILEYCEGSFIRTRLTKQQNIHLPFVHPYEAGTGCRPCAFWFR